MTTAHIPSKPAKGQWAVLLIALTGRRLAVTLIAAVLIALAINPIFEIPLTMVFGRVILVAMALLLAFTYVEQLPLGRLPRWLMQVIALGVAAPSATFVAYLLSVSGNLQAFLNHPGRIWGFFIMSSIALVFGLLVGFGAMLREREAQFRAQTLEFALAKEQIERQAVNAQLGQLQAQIKPHFLFNTLANVQELVETGSPRAAPVFKSLIAYLRASMPQLNQSHATLGNELELVRAYLDLMSMRMPDRLRYCLQVDETLKPLRFPPMALLTLVENAVRHGIDPSEEGGEIEVGADHNVIDGTVRVWVTDTGLGMAETAAPGTGLSNLRQHINAFFGPGSALEFSAPPPLGLRAELLFTAER